jgi:hypothetical protein
MNPREKVLVCAVGGLLGLGLATLGVRAVLLKPLREIDKKNAVLRDKMEKIKAERRAYFTAEDTVKTLTQHTFGDQIDQASARSGEILTKQIESSGLREADFSRLPAGPKKLRGANEIGWSIQGQGKLVDVVNLLFTLQESPYVHRIENLAISSGDSAGQVRVGFRFLTLVFDPAPVVDPIALATPHNLDSAERKRFDGIVARDVLRPYVKRTPGKSGTSPETPATLAGPGSLRVVSLSDWMGQPEVHVRDLANQKTLHYKPGDELAGGTVVAVDYRPLPMPGHDGLNSFSRVIVRIDTDYWAIERGQTLAEKRRLPPEQLPAGLSKL